MGALYGSQPIGYDTIHGGWPPGSFGFSAEVIVETMEVEVKLFATLREYLPKGSGQFSCKMEIDGQTRIKDILVSLRIPTEIPKIILVNGVHGKPDQVLKKGDVVSLFPPVAGG